MGSPRSRARSEVGELVAIPAGDEPERWAIRCTDLMFHDKDRLDAAFYDGLKTRYSDPQIMELGAWAALVWGLAGWFRTLSP